MKPAFTIHTLLAALIGLASVDTTLRAQDKPAPATDANLFASDRVVEVVITMDPKDWDMLRNQERDIAVELGKERLERGPTSPYTWFPADVTIDGTRLERIGVRKRGFVGSADKERPGLNLDFNRFVPDQNYAGRTAWKLHNNKQDASNMRQLLAYSVFREAGVPAPRCGFATVKVNGVNLGVYSTLEGIDKAFLKSHFGSDAGNLYEAQISDFRPGWTRTFEKKNNRRETSRADLDALVRALEAEDSSLVAEVSQVLDIDAFLSFWAVESLINHWDGFTGDLNNCFVYSDPVSGKIRFIPWGTDGTFGTQHIFVPFDPPHSVWAVSYLARRLYNHPTTQEKYRARLREILGTVWNEANLLGEVDRVGKLLAGLSTAPEFQSGAQTEQLRQFIRERRGQLEPELKRPAKPWNFPMRRELYITPIGSLSARFNTAWVPHAFVPAPGKARAEVVLDVYNHRYTAEFTDVKAAPDIANPQNATVLLSGRFKEVEAPISIWLSVHTNFFSAGTSLEKAGGQGGILLSSGQFGTGAWRMLGSGTGAATTLDDASRRPGEKVSGTIKAEFANVPWEDFHLRSLPAW